MQDIGKSGYNITNVLLIESFFFRKEKIDFNIRHKSKIDVNVLASINTENTKVVSSVTLHYSLLSPENENLVEAKIKMAGLFQKIGETNIDLEQFGKVNGAAIVFPFVREHLASLSAKAGINSILLPPVNFVELSKTEKK